MSRASMDEGVYRIGELARRVGVSEHVLRAWERRYDLVEPARTGGGYRLYSVADERRVRHVCRLIAQGVPAAEAARMALAADGGATRSATDPATSRLVRAGRRRLRAALLSMAEPRAQAALDDVLATVPFDVVARRVLMPILRELGDGWRDGRVSVAQEHFATAIVRGRLAGLARGWGAGSGPYALLACPPDERHDLGLQVFGILLARHGWSISFLGSDTPVEAIAAATAARRVDAVVLSATDGARLVAVANDLRELATGGVTVWLAGPGADAATAERAGAEWLWGDPVDAAAAVDARRH